MRLAYGFIIVLTACLFIPAGMRAPGQSDPSRAVPGGGISVPGWVGKPDTGSGQTVNDAKLSQEGGALHVTTGPAITYWNPANTATGDYTVKATFHEPKY